MPSTPSPNLRIQLIASGEQSNTWGTTTNTNLGTLIEQAICGMAPITLTTTTYTLSAMNYVQDQARMMILNFNGSPGGNCTVTAPAVSKMYIVANNTADNSGVTLTTGSGSTTTVPSGFNAVVWCDGTNFFAGNTALVNNVVYQTGPNGAAMLPAGTTAQRPGSPVAGEVRANTDTSKFEGYIGGAWGSIGGGATGGGPDQVFVQNQAIVTTNYTLSTGYNAESVGPITINAGVTVTIPSGQKWLIL